MRPNLYPETEVHIMWHVTWCVTWQGACILWLHPIG